MYYAMAKEFGWSLEYIRNMDMSDACFILETMDRVNKEKERRSKKRR